MRAAYSATRPRPGAGRRGNPGHGVCRLHDQRDRLGTLGLLGHGRIREELREAAMRAKPHLQGVNRIGAWIVIPREVVAGGLVAQVQHYVSRLPAAGPAVVLLHLHPRPGNERDGHENVLLNLAHSSVTGALGTVRGRIAGQVKTGRAELPRAVPCISGIGGGIT